MKRLGIKYRETCIKQILDKKGIIQRREVNDKEFNGNYIGMLEYISILTRLLLNCDSSNLSEKDEPSIKRTCVE
jgi:hypothetical protein